MNFAPFRPNDLPVIDTAESRAYFDRKKADGRLIKTTLDVRFRSFGYFAWSRLKRVFLYPRPTGIHSRVLKRILRNPEENIFDTSPSGELLSRAERLRYATRLSSQRRPFEYPRERNVYTKRPRFYLLFFTNFRLAFIRSR